MVKLTEAEKKQASAEKAPHEGHGHADVSDHEKKDAKEKQPEKKTKEEKAKPVENALKSTATLHDLEVVLYPLVTEKSVGLIESQNKLTFIVNDKSAKPEIKKVLEEAYGIKVNGINVIRDRKGRKKAIVQIDKKYKATDLATKLGVL